MNRIEDRRARHPEDENGDEEDPDLEEAKRVLKKIGKFVLKTALLSGGIFGTISIGLPALGFGALGPIAGSFAAAYQSSVGAITAGSTFATLQSVGMVGLSAAAKTTIVAGSAVVSAASSGGRRR